MRCALEEVLALSGRLLLHQDSTLGRRSDINWHAVQLDFRLGLLSIREIAKKHGVADSNLRARARREEWSRGDGETAKAAALQAVAAEMTESARAIGAEIGAQQARVYREAVGDGVLTALEITREHQLAARRGLDTAMGLLQELQAACATRDLIEVEIERCRDDDAARAALIERQLGLKGRIEAFDKWSSSFSKLTSAEREAHEIGAGKRQNDIDDLLLRIHQERLASR